MESAEQEGVKPAIDSAAAAATAAVAVASPAVADGGSDGGGGDDSAAVNKVRLLFSYSNTCDFCTRVRLTSDY